MSSIPGRTRVPHQVDPLSSSATWSPRSLGRRRGHRVPPAGGRVHPVPDPGDRRPRGRSAWSLPSLRPGDVPEDPSGRADPPLSRALAGPERSGRPSCRNGRSIALRAEPCFQRRRVASPLFFAGVGPNPAGFVPLILGVALRPSAGDSPAVRAAGSLAISTPLPATDHQARAVEVDFHAVDDRPVEELSDERDDAVHGVGSGGCPCPCLDFLDRPGPR